MKVGDLVIRKIDNIDVGHITSIEAAMDQRRRLGHGVVLSRQMGGLPSHPCVSVFYPRVGKVYDIAESLMEVISEAR